MKHLSFQNSLVVVGIIMTLVVMSLALFSSPVEASPALLPACGAFQWQTSCFAGCVINYPTTSCASGYMFQDVFHSMNIYQYGKKDLGNIITVDSCVCDGPTHCQTTCQ